MQESLNMQSAWISEQWNLTNWSAFAKEKQIDLTVVGMDDPLVGGIVDVFEAEGLRVFGPRKERGDPGGIQSIFKRSDEKI